MTLKRMLLLLLLAMLLAGCAGASAEGGLSVVCTDFPCYDFARQAAGEFADVTMLIKPGAEVHAYDPTPSDILAIGGADLFVYIGGESDAWVESILSGFDAGDAPRALRLMDCVSGLLEEEGEADRHESAEGPEYDEHIWTSLPNAAAMVRAVGAALSEADPEHADDYAGNAAAYAAEIEALDAEIRDMVAGAARRELVFADRFPFLYFVREYGLDYLAAFPSCTADTEPSAQVLTALIRRVIDGGIPAVYTIELSTQAIARTVAEETGAEILTLQSLQTVSQDDFDAGKTYVSLMRENLGALRKGLN